MKPMYKLTFAFVLISFSSLVLTYCKKDKNSNKRSPETDNTKLEDLPFDDSASGITIKADTLAFNRNSSIRAEPSSCFALDITILGGEDAFLASLDEDTTVSLTSTSPSTEFFKDESCEKQGSEILFAKGSSYGTLFVRDQKPGTIDLKASTSKGISLKPAEIKVISEKAAKIKFLTLIERSFTVNNCEPVIITFRSKDDLEINTAKATPVNLAVTNGAGQFFGSEDCSGTPLVAKDLPKGNSDTTLYVKATSTGPLTLQAIGPKDSGYETAIFTVNVDSKN